MLTGKRQESTCKRRGLEGRRERNVVGLEAVLVLGQVTGGICLRGVEATRDWREGGGGEKGNANQSGREED